MPKTNEGNVEEITVDPNTDDLDEFNKLMTGHAKAKEEDDVEDIENNQDDDQDDVDDAHNDDDDSGEDSDPPAQDDDEETDDGDDDSDDDQDDDDAGKRKKPTVQDRINELVAKQRQAERERDEALAKLQERENTADEKTTQARTKPLEEDAPDPDAVDENGDPIYPRGDFDPLYLRDMVRWTNKVEREELRKIEEEERTKEQQQKAEEQLISNWEGKLIEAEEAIPDIRQKGAELETTFRNLESDYGQFLAKTIMGMDYGPQVIAYLADNISEAEDIVNSGPTTSVLKLGRLEAQIAAASLTEGPDKKKPKVSKAPTPPPVNKGRSTSRSAPPDTDDLDAFMRDHWS